MLQDYRELDLDQLEELEKQSLFAIVHALQQYSAEAKRIFDNTPVLEDSEIVVLAEDIVQYAIEVAEVYPINFRFAGFTDYKRIRWMSTSLGVIPQVLLVDAKASTEKSRASLQRSQLCMRADWEVNGRHLQMEPGIPPDWALPTRPNALNAVTTSIFVHLRYRVVGPQDNRRRELLDMYALCLPHARLKMRYNPDAQTSFWIKGRESDGGAVPENPRIRVSFKQLQDACRWRLQQLTYPENGQSATGSHANTINAGHPRTSAPGRRAAPIQTTKGVPFGRRLGVPFQCRLTGLRRTERRAAAHACIRSRSGPPWIRRSRRARFVGSTALF